MNGDALFSLDCKFMRGATSAEHFPEVRFPEIAVVGRSNVGKSSLINALTGKRDLARASNTPGRTQQINFFLLGDRMMLVDLPGYGYAKAPKSHVAAWNRLMARYLRGRENLKRVLVLIDSRHGLKDSDHEMMDILDDAAILFQVVLTKGDKNPEKHNAAMLEAVKEGISRHAAAYPEVLFTSAEKKTGIKELRNALAELL